MNAGQTGGDNVYDTLRDPEFWLFRIFPLQACVPVAILAAIVAWVVLATTQSVPGAIGAAVAVLLIGLVPIRRRTPAVRLSGWIGRRLAGRTDTIDRAPAFDVPLAEGGGCGMRWDGDLLLTMLRIDPPPDTLTLLRSGSLSADQLMPITEIARCLDQFDVQLVSIDVIATGARTAGIGAAAQLYDRILGPLPAIAHRTCWLVLRLDPVANATAVGKRGGGAEGALRTMIITTRRVANRLATHGIDAAVLTATEMNSALRQLTHGFDPLRLTESAHGLATEQRNRPERTTSLREQVTGQREQPEHTEPETPPRHLTHYQLTAPMITTFGFAEIWSTPSLSTTVTLRLHPGARRTDRRDDKADTVVLNAVVRFDTATPLDDKPLPGLRELPGSQGRILLDTLPIGAADDLGGRDGYRGTLVALADIAVPTTGCGQLIGADATGQGIAVPLIGEGTRHVDVIGNLDLAQQVILRATALGAHAIVHTARPQAWQSMVANLAMPQLLSIAPRAAGATPPPQLGPAPMPAAPYPTTTVLVYDGIAPTSHLGGATVVEVRTAERDHDDFAPDVTLTQDPHSPNRITVRTSTGTATVTMVTTPDEMHYIGESLAAR
ncbi:type VII secretion protein EccE [Nocardia sp. XZ_19_231]|uniref:type VII secretion protein EccE n=1 Tax=Nocardia sp. XZ_19_231 TaxID=2769252 RepID=UPI00188EB1A6|nr:type VII secretion protein EccE [Nocardia sp. XZ_19_231]